MFDLGWSELLVIGVVALIVVGPKDLPVMFRRLGEFTGKARRMAREFQTAMNDAARDSGVGDVTKDLHKIANPKKFGIDAVREAAGDLKAWSPDESTGPATRALSEERAEAKRKISEATAARAEARRAAQAAELSEEPGLRPDPEAPAPADPVAAAEPEPEHEAPKA